MYDVLGVILSICGSLLGVIGSWFVTSGKKEDRKMGFKYWIISNPINIVVLLGVLFGLWSSISLIIPICIQVYFFITAIRGYNENTE